MSMKSKYDSINWSKVDPEVKAQFDEIKADTKDFTNETAMDSFKENFDMLMEMVPADAIKKDEPKVEPKKEEKKAEPKEPKKHGRKPGTKNGGGKKEKKAKPATKVKVKATGKDVSEITAEECLEAWRSRRAAAKKSAKKAKTTPVFERITDKIEAAIETAIRNEPAEDIKKSPAKFISKIEDLGSAGKQFIQKFRSILGEDYDGDEVKEFEKHFDALVDKLRKKYVK